MKLVFLSGTVAGQRYAVDGSVRIGRDPSNDIVLSDSSVSLVHCEVSFDGGVGFVKDMGSTNGTFVNKHQIIGARLFQGDQIVVGANVIRVDMPEVGTHVHADAGMARGDELHAGQPAGTPPAEASEELSGNIFGTVKYFLKRKIADGGMGSIYEAEQIGAEGFVKRVALKTILPKYARRQSFVSSFIGEAKLVANLVHQNIVQIHHLGRQGDGYYIAMEYIDGITLTDFIIKHAHLGRRSTDNMATFIVSRICRGLEYAHSKEGDDGVPLGLVHRDVSPNNIMISREGEVKLTDFGVAKAGQFMDEDDDSLVGSVEYMAPEQAACANVDARSDLYSLGLVYYELLSGVRVFQSHGESLEQSVERLQKAEIPHIARYRPDLDPDVAGIVMRCVEKDPSARYQSAGELGSVLEKQMYSHGLGPTIVTLAAYVAGMHRDLAGTGW